MHRRPVQGFTLIELLVVISIVSLLVALLLPALAKSRTATHMAQSLSNVRQLQVPLHAYANDNSSKLPFIRWPQPPPSPGTYTGPWGGAYWSGMFYHGGYVSNINIYWSPMRNRSELDMSWAMGPGGPGQSNWSKVGYAMIGYGAYNSHTPMENLNTAKPMPSRTISMIEAWRSDAQGTNNPRPGYFQLHPWHNASDVHRVYTYDGRAARAYFDGHAEGTDANRIGWNPRHPDSTVEYGNYGGGWTHSLDDWRYRAPWYMLWKDAMLN